MKAAASPTPAAAPQISNPSEMLGALTGKLKELEEKIDSAYGMLKRNGAARFGPDDQFFLAWVLGFTAGAHLERNGEQGERIFGRCRDMWLKVQEARQAGGNAS